MGIPGLLGLLRTHCAENHVPPVDLAKLGSSSPQALVLAVDGYALLFYLISQCEYDTRDDGARTGRRPTAIQSREPRIETLCTRTTG